jgi:hypothetical protein
MKKVSCLFASFLLLHSILLGQNAEFKLQNYRPVSPSAFQFLKYTEMPVSEYTGVPNISIPLYQINVDGVSLPITLSYHAGGIRVNQEASWVGLGWDLTTGSIVQEINDIDDYSPYTNTVRKLPDWNTSPVPQNFPLRWQYPNTGLNGLGWSNPYPIQSPQAQHSYMISTAYYVPINGNFDDQATGQALFTYPEYDSEPDIFKANFFGHSISFVRSFPTGSNIIVLNKKGYKVTRTGDTYIITVPGGEQFYFEIVNTVESWATTTGGIGGGGGSGTWEPSSKIWMLTKVITRNNRQILFNYSQSAVVENYPNYSQKWSKAVEGSSNYYSIITSCFQPYVYGYNEISILGETASTFSFSRESRATLSSITFPNGEITFNSSNRDDLLGGKKLDNVQLTSGQLIKSFQFSYEYFDAASVGGNVYQPYNAATFGNTVNKRLKLLSVQDNAGAVHTFTYSNIPLAAKNSFAQDFWGYYNGQLTNTSLIPNPARLNLTSLGDNGNNNSANSNYIKAGTLTEIQFPTGGKTQFDYELNTFSNYWVPDYNTTINTSSSGNGIRIRSISYLDMTKGSTTISKKTQYTYEGGKAIVPLNMHRIYSFNRIMHLNPPTKNISSTNFQVNELNAKGFFSTNALGSINAVGYDKVIRQELDLNNNSTGKTETYFNNTPDIVSNSANGSSQLSAALPAIKNRTVPENGTVSKIQYYNSQNSLVKKIENTYVTYQSDESAPLFYGARIFGYISLFYVEGLGSGGSGCAEVAYWNPLPQNLIGYYPIYDNESLLYSKVTTDYDPNGSLTTTETFGYDLFHVLYSRTNITSEGRTIVETYDHAYDYYIKTGSSILINSNWLTDITSISKSQYYNGGTAQLSKNDKEYSNFGGRTAVNKLTIKPDAVNNTIPTEIFYDQYDSYANPLQYRKDGETNSVIWDYNGTYAVATIQNSDQASVAYTSFEADGKGNWNYTGNTIADNTSPTGKKAYDLDASTISKSGLNSAKTHIVTFWSKNGSGSSLINGSNGALVVIKNGWSLYKMKLPIGTTTVTISGSAIIDELRLHPQDAIMITNTYIPLVGVSSECDANNKINYYEYDVTGRLVLIKDQDLRVIKKLCYNYAGQPEDCLSPCTNTTAEWQNTATALRCQLNAGQNTGYQEQEQKDMNPCSPTYNQLRWIQTVYNTTACPLQATCNSGNCSGNDKKCINGVCETGAWVVISATRASKNDPWTCVWAYCFSDGSTSTYTQTTTSSTICAIGCY